jgi:hypothetical protein
MAIRTLLLPALLAAGLSIALAVPLTCVAAVANAPPEPQFEAAPGQRTGYVWLPGYWDYQNDKYVWIAGRSVSDRPGYAYTPHRWVQRDGRWELEQGHWEKR